MPPRKRTAPGAETPEGNKAAATRAERSAAKVRARFVQAVSGVDRSFVPGEVVEVDQATAAAWTSAGWAEVEDD